MLSFLALLSAFFCRFAFGESPLAVFGLSTASFLVPVVMLWIAAAKWRSARLSSADSEALADVLSIAVLEGRFGEAARLLERNRERLPLLSRRVCRALFDPALIAPMFGSGSFIHLGLLADSTVLEDSECDRFQIVDSVVRGLVLCERSPLRSAVIDAFRGHEFHEYPPEDAAIIDATFKNPGWYLKTNAHYSLLIPAIERLNSGEFDADYNGNGRHYEAEQGISTRSRCSLYLALKTHVLALREAVNTGIDDDFYVTDLLDLFRVVRQRSHFDGAVWESGLTNFEHPTPFAFLLYEILHDLEDLFCRALPLEGRLPHDIALTWSFCVWDLATSKDNVSESFRLCESANYLTFALQLAYAPHEACPGKLPEPSVTKAKRTYWWSISNNATSGPCCLRSWKNSIRVSGTFKTSTNGYQRSLACNKDSRLAFADQQRLKRMHRSDFSRAVRELHRGTRRRSSVPC
ncbi:MAG: hypothetical protein E2P02_23690 [Acidobacteria bacterium]|nr:MAG: hypothetical protein E2P02_23690 [Acidobacteriota bacterium]